MIKINEKNTTRKENITVRFFYQNASEKFKIIPFNSDYGYERKITDQNLNRPGLALAGFVDLFTYNRIQIFGNTENQYLSKLNSTERKEALERIFKFEVPCVVLTDGNTPSDEMMELAVKYKTALFGSKYPTTKLIYFISDFLDDQFAPRVSLHGSFVDVYGVGMLFVGKSGVGKSEVALDLIERGHRLVADDVVILTKKGEGILIGAGTDLVKHFMEVRGIGIIDVKSMFGIRAIRYQKRLEVVIQMELWESGDKYTRTGLDTSSESILDVDVPVIKIPILPGKNLTVISEVIALNYLLKHYGYDTAVEFQNRLNEKIKAKSMNRTIEYFEHDFE